MFKSHSFALKNLLNRSSKKKFIYKQRTLLGCFCKLMEKQKLAVGIVRVLANKKEKIVPFVFKIDENNVPTNLHPLRIHRKNMVTLEIDGVKSMNCMIVSIGDDSKDVIENYKVFLDKVKESEIKIAPIENKITHFLAIEKIRIGSISETLNPIPIQDFDSWLRRVNIVTRRFKAKTSQDESQADSAVIDVDSNSSDSDDEDYDSDYENPGFGESSTAKKSSSDEKKKIKSNDFDREKITQSLEKIKSLSVTNENIDEEMLKDFAAEIHDVLFHLTKQIENREMIEYYHSFSGETDGIRIIPEEDQTIKKDSKILIEGVLPLSYDKYQVAMNMKSTKDEEFGPAGIISNLIRFCFPRHWIENVTLRGSAGRQSLITIWNYRDPLKDPPKEPFETYLGESRFRALLDHAVRKSGRKSYDKDAEKSMIGSLSKAMHYARGKIGIGKKSNSSKNKSGSVLPLNERPTTSTRGSSIQKESSPFQLGEVETFEFQMEDSVDSQADQSSPINNGRERGNKITDDKDDEFEVVDDDDNGADSGKGSSDQIVDSDETNVFESKTLTVVVPDQTDIINYSMRNQEKEFSKSESSIEEELSKNGSQSPKFHSTPKRKSREIDSPQSPSKKNKIDLNNDIPSSQPVIPAATEILSSQPVDSIGTEIPSSQPVNWALQFRQPEPQEPATTSTNLNEAEKMDESSPVDEEENISEADAIEFLKKIRRNKELFEKLINPVGVRKDPKILIFGFKFRHYVCRNYQIFQGLRFENKSISFVIFSMMSFLRRKLTQSTAIGTKSNQLKVYSSSAAKDQPKPSTSNSTSKSTSSQSVNKPKNAPVSFHSQPSKNFPEKEKDSFSVILPLFIDSSQKKLQQPVLVTFKNDDLFSLEIDYNREFYQDEEMNLFETQIKHLRFSFQMIALADSLTELREVLKESVKNNPSWKGLKKLINFTSQTIPIDYDSSKLDKTDLEYIMMSENDIKKLFSKEYENVKNQSKTLIEVAEDRDKDPSRKNEKENESSHALDSTNTKTKKGAVDMDESERGKSEKVNRKRIKLSKIGEKTDDLNRKKLFLSELDTSGKILRDVIEAIHDIHQYLTNKYHEAESSMIEIEFPDPTYKIKAKNQIFIEGKLELQLNLYEKALKFAKIRDPNSIAYQLTRIAFPKSYYNNTTLGKKFYTAEELKAFHERFNQDSTIQNEKIPLSFVFGFQDPFNKPFQGKFDYKLGIARLDGFFDHIFRMAGETKYSEQALGKVRFRIIRVLYQLNKNDETGEDSPKSADNESLADDSADVDFGDEIFKSDIWQYA
uniref:Uncharacterized protein n=1 Tax=Tetranychus urticae TaxID=32264 RepID=T1KE65_TETUR